MKVFSISARCIAAPPPADWRTDLTRMLGAKPRRIGTWGELGLYGALRCMAEAGETVLPQDAILMLASRRGTYVATDLVLEQMREDLPMPLAFLQTQPSQLLALLSAQIQWRGHACFFACTEQHALLRLAAAQSGKDGVLLGWVDEMEGGSTNWLRLIPDAAAGISSDNPLEPNPLQLPLVRGRARSAPPLFEAGSQQSCGVPASIPLAGARGGWEGFASNEQPGINFMPATSDNGIFSPTVSHIAVAATHLQLAYANK